MEVLSGVFGVPTRAPTAAFKEAEEEDRRQFKRELRSREGGELLMSSALHQQLRGDSVLVVSSAGVDVDRSDVLRWARKLNGQQQSAQPRVGGVVCMTVTQARRDPATAEASPAAASTPRSARWGLASAAAAAGWGSAPATARRESRSRPRRCFKSLTSGEVRWFPDNAFEDVDGIEDVYEWAREEIMCSFEAGVDVVIIDEVGPEVIHGQALDSAIRACLWKAAEEADACTTRFVLVADPDVLPQLGDLYDVAEGGVMSRFSTLRDLARWVRALSLTSRSARVRHLAAAAASADGGASSMDEDPDRPLRFEEAHRHHGTGPFYTVARIPLLLVTVWIIALELFGYVVVRQVVVLFEGLFRKNRGTYNALNKSTSYSSWRRNARLLDVKEHKSGGSLAHVPTLAHHGRSLRRAARHLVMDSLHHSERLRASTGDGDSSGASVGSDDGHALEAEAEHELLGALRACITSLNELVNEHMYASNYTGSNLEMRSLTSSVMDALDEVQECGSPELLHFKHWTVAKRKMARASYSASRGSMVAMAGKFLSRLNTAASPSTSATPASTSETTKPPAPLLQDGPLADGVNGATDALSEATPERAGAEESVGEDHLLEAFGESKRRFFSELAHTYGETALCLSGGAGNAFYHLGVVRTLLEHDVLPQYISGASGGALVGAYVCTKTDDELRELMQAKTLCKVFDPCSAGYLGMARNLVEEGNLFNVEDWINKMVNQVCGTLTFREAWERTHKALVIPVYNIDAKGKQHTRVLCYKTTPDVVIYSAVLASSALPRLLPAIELLRKDARGRITPFHSLGRFWRDGSFQNELPFNALRQLFNVSFTVVSQVEPHLSPFFYSHRGAAGRPVSHGRGRGWRGGFALSYFERLLKLDLKKWLELVRDFSLMPRVMSVDASSIFLGNTRGTVTLVPPIRAWSYLHLVADPNTPQIMQDYLSYGSRMAWPAIAMLQDRVHLERKLQELADAA